MSSPLSDLSLGNRAVPISSVRIDGFANGKRVRVAPPMRYLLIRRSETLVARLN